jgi:hypothetical protein
MHAGSVETATPIQQVTMHMQISRTKVFPTQPTHQTFFLSKQTLLIDQQNMILLHYATSEVLAQRPSIADSDVQGYTVPRLKHLSYE